MKKFISPILICTICLYSCTKINSSNQAKKDSTLLTLLSSVTYYDNIYQYYSRKDSFSYNQKGSLASWINYTYQYQTGAIATMDYSFALNQNDQISSYSVVSTDYLGDQTQLHYDIGYDNQNRISGKTASPPAADPDNEFDVIYQYGPNSIIFKGVRDGPLYDTMQFSNNNMIYRSHRGVGEVRGSMNTFENFKYSNYTSPFYDSSLSNVGALFFTCFTYNAGIPETDFLGDVLSKNLADSLYFMSSLFYPTEWGYYKYAWTTDSVGNVDGGNVLISDSSRDNTGYESLQMKNYNIKFNYKTQWLYR